MAIDTRNDRMSLIGLGLPAPMVLPNPNGGITKQDRYMLLRLYAFESPAVVVSGGVSFPSRPAIVRLKQRIILSAWTRLEATGQVIVVSSRTALFASTDLSAEAGVIAIGAARISGRLRITVSGYDYWPHEAEEEALLGL